MSNAFVFILRYIIQADHLIKVLSCSSVRVDFGKRVVRTSLFSTAVVASKMIKRGPFCLNVRKFVECIWITFSIDISSRLFKRFLFPVRKAFWFVMVVSKSFKSRFAFSKDRHKMDFDFLRTRNRLVSFLARNLLTTEIQSKYLPSFYHLSYSGLYFLYCNKYCISLFFS